MAKTEKIGTPEALRAFAAERYAAEYAAASDEERSRGLSPAKTKTAARERGYLSPEGIVDPLYFEENGKRNPLPLPKGAKALDRNGEPTAALVAAIRKRRKTGGTLGRLESVAAAASATAGVRISRRAVDLALYEGGAASTRLDRERDYAGRGTRARAKGTRVA